MINFIYLKLRSYQILAPTEMYNEKEPKNAAKLCFDKIGLDPDLYRIGHTKARKNTKNTPDFFLDFFFPKIEPLSESNTTPHVSIDFLPHFSFIEAFFSNDFIKIHDP